MNYFSLFLLLSLAPSAMATAAERPLQGLPGMPPIVRHYESSKETSRGADRTITWRAWKVALGGEFRVRTGNRYVGGTKWEHYLGFEQHPASGKEIKLSMIHLGSEDVREDLVIRPGSRYAIVKVTNGSMTAHKGVWSWTAQEVY